MEYFFIIKIFNSLLQNFIERNRSENDLPSPVSFGLKRLGIGFAYMIFHLLGSTFVSIEISFLVTQDRQTDVIIDFVMYKVQKETKLFILVTTDG